MRHSLWTFKAYADGQKLYLHYNLFWTMLMFTITIVDCIKHTDLEKTNEAFFKENK